MSKLWQDLATSALVGPDRKPWQPPTGPDALSQTLAALNGDVLQAAAVISLHRRAGTTPPAPARELRPACEPDPRTRCSARAAFHLKAMLTGTHPSLLGEWLTALNSRNQRVPEELVPDLLQAGLKQHRGLVLKAAGPIAEWLQMPVAHAVPAASNTDWETATTPERIAILHKLRGTAPQEAVAKIQSTWDTDKADQRKDFLETLYQSLNPQDESFLEGALDDKSIVVRRAAVDLLAKIPNSRLLKRLEQAMEGRLKLTTKGFLLTRKTTLDLDPFPELTPALIRDGIEKKGAPQGMGERAWWTQQALALIAPAHWSAVLRSAPQDLIKAAANGDDAALLMIAWAQAAARHRDTQWARALLDAGMVNQQLFQILPAKEKEELGLSGKPFEPYIDLCQHPWSYAFTRAAIPVLAQWPAYRARELARFAHLDATDLPPELGDFAAVLNFRRDMHQALHHGTH